ncbi:elongation factor 2 [Achlya hypogyna]|uniref:Elongation factor 2 n=1 Tax=Achlya hypogyna TaxID=1202772 RepID=A0A1V9ZT69_ACHHY|nr:elongation factor 2 [Achlya hypogyna]
MVNFTAAQLRDIMNSTTNIRNLAVIAHVDHGKSTLTDALVAKAGIISTGAAGSARYTDTRDDEKERGITIKSTGISMYFETPAKEPFLINLIDSPGHVDFSSEVTAALRVTDGALVVVDAVDGVCVQTETVLRQAIGERVKPVLVVNKVDRALLELQLPPEDCYQVLRRAVESVNVILATCTDAALGDVQVHPETGSVAFGSGLHQWAFTLSTFANLYAAKFGTNAAKLLPKLWGDWGYDAVEKKWTTQRAAKGLPRAFVQFVMDPICKVFEAVTNNQPKKLAKMLGAIGVPLSVLKNGATGQPLTGRDLLKSVMHAWLPAGDAILDMVVTHLPSPVVAQRYRVDTLYDGPLDDECAVAIRNCDASGPLVMYVSKMVPTSADRTRFYAFGRVFSGAVATGQKVRLLGPNYVPGSATDLFTNKTIQRTVVMMGRAVEAVADVPAGNTCALVGVDQYLLKSGTITTSETGCTIRTMKFSVSPVMRVAVAPASPADLPKLIEGMRRLAKSDPMVQCYTEATGEHIVAGAGELHLDICLADLENDFMGGARLVRANPIVTYRETITSPSGIVCLAKSSNKHNRLFCTATPLGSELVTAMEARRPELSDHADVKTRARYLADSFGWDVVDGRKIWGYGPDHLGTNVFVDQTKGIANTQDIRDSVVRGFQWATATGVLCDEAVSGARVNLIDVLFHPNAAHRGTDQLLPAARRVVHACQLVSAPALLEPMFLVEVQCPQDVVGGVYSTLHVRRGVVIAEEPKANSSLHLRAYLPVVESFGFTEALRAKTGGKAFPQCWFDHYEVVDGDPLLPTTLAGKLVAGTRARKGLRPDIAPLDHFLDKL